MDLGITEGWDDKGTNVDEYYPKRTEKVEQVWGAVQCFGLRIWKDS